MRRANASCISLTADKAAMHTKAILCYVDLLYPDGRGKSDEKISINIPNFVVTKFTSKHY